MSESNDERWHRRQHELGACRCGKDRRPAAEPTLQELIQRMPDPLAYKRIYNVRIVEKNHILDALAPAIEAGFKPSHFGFRAECDPAPDDSSRDSWSVWEAALAGLRRFA
jgi:hypothetical protein